MPFYICFSCLHLCNDRTHKENLKPTDIWNPFEGQKRTVLLKRNVLLLTRMTGQLSAVNNQHFFFLVLKVAGALFGIEKEKLGSENHWKRGTNL